MSFFINNNLNVSLDGARGMDQVIIIADQMCLPEFLILFLILFVVIDIFSSKINKKKAVKKK